MADFLRSLLAVSLLLAGAAPTRAVAQGAAGDAAAARSERRARYTKLAETGDRGEFAAACAGFAQLDVEEPNETFLRAALRACVLANDLERTAELTRRASRSTPSAELQDVLQDASSVLRREGGFIVVRCKEPCTASVDGKEAKAGVPFWAARGSVQVTFDVGGRLLARAVDVQPGTTTEVEPPPTPALPGPVTLATTDRKANAKAQTPVVPPPTESDARVSPVLFFIGLGLSAGLTGGTIASAVDTKNRHDEFELTGVGADEGEAAQLRTNVLFFTTLGVGLATGAVGIFATDWGGSGDPDGALARLTLSY